MSLTTGESGTDVRTGPPRRRATASRGLELVATGFQSRYIGWALSLRLSRTVNASVDLYGSSMTSFPPIAEELPDVVIFRGWLDMAGGYLCPGCGVGILPRMWKTPTRSQGRRAYLRWRLSRAWRSKIFRHAAAALCLATLQPYRAELERLSDGHGRSPISATPPLRPFRCGPPRTKHPITVARALPWSTDEQHYVTYRQGTPNTSCWNPRTPRDGLKFQDLGTKAISGWAL